MRRWCGDGWVLFEARGMFNLHVLRPAARCVCNIHASIRRDSLSVSAGVKPRIAARMADPSIATWISRRVVPLTY